MSKVNKSSLSWLSALGLLMGLEHGFGESDRVLRIAGFED